MATEVPGNFITASLWNAQVGALGNFTLGPPRFRGLQTLAQSFAYNAYAPLSLDTEVFDSEGGHSTTTNTSRYTVQVPGTYLLMVTVAWAADTSGSRIAEIHINGTAIPGTYNRVLPVGAVVTPMNTQVMATLNVGDYVEAYGMQNGPTTLTTYATVSGGLVCASFSALWISS